MSQADARAWAREMERRIDLGQSLTTPLTRHVGSLGKMITLHIQDMCDVGRAPLRSKAHCLEKLHRELGSIEIRNLDRASLVTYGMRRAKAGAGPVTLGMELGYLRLVVMHAAAVHGLAVSCEAIDHARIALKRLGLIGKGQERDRRPTPEEINRLLTYLNGNPRQTIPVGRIILFAIATGLRQDEISRVQWEDVNESERTILIRNRKHPRDKRTNNQTIALVTDTGFNPFALMAEQASLTGRKGRVFPYNSRSIGAAFRRACRHLGIRDLRFHDLRHETASRLFEAGYQIPEVALVTGHKDWSMLRRYTNLKARDLAARRLAMPQRER